MIRIAILVLFPFLLNSQIIIKSEDDIKKIDRLGVQFIVDGPADPLEFFDFLQKIEPLIEDHIKKLSNDIDPETELTRRITADLFAPNAVSTLAGKYKKKELSDYADLKGVDSRGNENAIIERLIEWAKKQER